MTPSAKQNQNQSPTLRNVGLWFVCAVIWFIIDRATKAYFATFAVGDVVINNIAGLFRFQIVHNTGMAWGTFSGGVSFIALFTIALCLVILIFSLYWARQATKLEMLALGLLFAGGVGNLVDRLLYGYVVDFIKTTFISFPTFNVADIGVTVGIAFLLVIWVVQIMREGETAAAQKDAQKECDQLNKGARGASTPNTSSPAVTTAATTLNTPQPTQAPKAIAPNSMPDTSATSNTASPDAFANTPEIATPPTCAEPTEPNNPFPKPRS